VGLAAQLVDRSIGSRSAITASALLVMLTVNVVLSLQLGRLAYDAPLALLLGAVAGAPLAAWMSRQRPGVPQPSHSGLPCLPLERRDLCIA
jgi:uncharacterized membrane protein YfcA